MGAAETACRQSPPRSRRTNSGGAAVESDVEARIKKNPWGSVAVAGLIGLLIGKMS